MGEVYSLVSLHVSVMYSQVCRKVGSMMQHTVIYVTLYIYKHDEIYVILWVAEILITVQRHLLSSMSFTST
jgi:hypothetical protein